MGTRGLFILGPLILAVVVLARLSLPLSGEATLLPGSRSRSLPLSRVKKPTRGELLPFIGSDLRGFGLGAGACFGVLGGVRRVDFSAAIVSWPRPESGSDMSILYLTRAGNSSGECPFVELSIGSWMVRFGVVGRDFGKEDLRLGMGMPNIVIFLRCCFSCSPMTTGLVADDRGCDGGPTGALSRLEWRGWVAGVGICVETGRASADLDLRFLDVWCEGDLPRRKS